MSGKEKDGKAPHPRPPVDVPTVPIEIMHWCPSSYRRAPTGSLTKDSRPVMLPVVLCMRRHLFTYLNELEMDLGCGKCPAIIKHIEQFGTRHQRRVPVNETGHEIRFKDERSGKTIITSAREWRRVERLGAVYFVKTIDGTLHMFDEYAARNIGIVGAYPKSEPVITKITASNPVAPTKSKTPTWDRLTAKRDIIREAEKKGGKNGVSVHEGPAKILRTIARGEGPTPKNGAHKRSSKPTESLSSLTTGALLADEAKKMQRRKAEIEELRRKHVAKPAKKAHK